MCIVNINPLPSLTWCLAFFGLIVSTYAEERSFREPILGRFSTFNKDYYLKKNFEFMADSQLKKNYNIPLLLYINGNPRESCGNFGSNVSMPIIGMKVVKTDHNIVTVSLPGGDEVDLRSTKGDPNEYVSRTGLWSGERNNDQFVLYSPSGEVINFKKGRASSIKLSKGDRLNFIYDIDGMQLKDLHSGDVLLNVRYSQMGVVEKTMVDGDTINFEYGYYPDGLTPKLMNIIYGNRCIDFSDSDIMNRTISYVDKFNDFVLSSNKYSFDKNWKLSHDNRFKYSYSKDCVRRDAADGKFWEEYSRDSKLANTEYRNSSGYRDQKIYTRIPSGALKLRKRIVGFEGAEKVVKYYWSEHGDLIKKQK